jgi:hypothetical protein
VPYLSERRASGRLVRRGVGVRAPQLYTALRGFCLGAFAYLTREVESGADVPFAFDEHSSRSGPAFYEYRPLVRDFVEDRAGRLFALNDTALALEELRREPATSIFARAHAGGRMGADQALFRAVLLPIVLDTADACGGFDWDDSAFDRAYAGLEGTLFGEERRYAAVAPLVGLEAGGTIELGGGIRVRRAAEGELRASWPDGARLAPDDFGRETDRMCVLELEQALPAGGSSAPDAPGELADAVTALRLATAGPIAAGPVLFERLDWRPYGIRPALPIAATQPPGEPIRLDSFRGSVARALRERLLVADADSELADALDRWELSLFQGDPFRCEQLRSALEALLGRGDGLWAASLRAGVLLGENGRERAEVLGALRALGSGRTAPAAADAVRRALVETLTHGDRLGLLAALDESLLGVRPRAVGSFAEQAIAS